MFVDLIFKTMSKSKAIILIVILISLLSSYVTLKTFRKAHELYEESGSFKATEYSWLFRLMLNCLGYATLVLPGYIVFKYLRKSDYFDRAGKDLISRGLFICFGDNYDRLPETNKAKLEAENLKTPLQECLGLLLCFFGLMGSYLTWGLLQEKIMTQPYTSADGTMSHFRDSQFLVFLNRLSAFTIASMYLLAKGQMTIRSPLYKFSFCSFSNIMSAWCQYEALKYVSFPTQVLSKACKIIPVMLMGKLVTNAKYEFYEYLTAILISFGMIFFLFGSNDDVTASTVTTLSGVILLSLYMLFDSFTSNWQDALFSQYTLTPVQMMCCVNLFSTTFTAISLAQQGGLTDSFGFMMEHRAFMFDCILISASSAVGQLFIFHTISSYGPVVFTIIMTLRQAFAILLSCIVYHHDISALGVIGIIIVFVAILLRIYCKRRLKKIKKRIDT